MASQFFTALWVAVAAVTSLGACPGLDVAASMTETAAPRGEVCAADTVTAAHTEGAASTTTKAATDRVAAAVEGICAPGGAAQRSE